MGRKKKLEKKNGDKSNAWESIIRLITAILTLAIAIINLIKAIAG